MKRPIYKSIDYYSENEKYKTVKTLVGYKQVHKPKKKRSRSKRKYFKRN